MRLASYVIATLLIMCGVYEAWYWYHMRYSRLAMRRYER